MLIFPIWEHNDNYYSMNLIGKQLLRDFSKKYVDARSHLESWEVEVELAQWNNPHELKDRYPKASIIKDHQVVFNIRGNNYRLLVKINYKNKIVLIKKIGTHKEYNNWNLG